MLNGLRIVVVLPAYNAARTLEQTWHEIPFDIVDRVILVDDQSGDQTLAIAERLGITSIAHPQNLGYGSNQKTCYREALSAGADIVIMLHPDYQYTPRLLAALASMIAFGEYDAAIASRVLGGRSLAGGMPFYKYVSNRVLTAVQNILMSQKLSEYHTGYRAFSSKVLRTLPLNENSNDFIFDNQMLAQILGFGFRLGEISCPTRYTAESSSIRFWPSVRYGLGVLRVSVDYLLHHRFGVHSRIFSPNGRDLFS